jgi:hypothetical protein
MRFKLPKTYKLVLALAVVAGPFIWLVLTEDGQRRSDLFLLHALGRPSFNVALDRLNRDVTLPMLEKQFPDVSFNCGPSSTDLGDQVCTAEIASFNGIPARAASLWTGGGRLYALRLDYRRRYHELLEESLTESFGQPERQVGGGQTVDGWTLPGGQLLMPATLEEDDDAALMWIAGRG